MIGRRQFFGAAGVGVGLLWSARDAAACSIVAASRTPFSDRRSRQAITEFITLLNGAPTLSDDELIRRQDEMSIALEDEWVEERVGGRQPGHIGRNYLFVKEFRRSGGRLDPRPIQIDDINLIRRLGNRATYQFTLKRYSYHPADPEGCNGMFTHEA